VAATFFLESFKFLDKLIYIRLYTHYIIYIYIYIYRFISVNIYFIASHENVVLCFEFFVI